jgi:hypothetical protein
MQTAVKIALVGKYTEQQDAYLSVMKAFRHSAIHLGMYMYVYICIYIYICMYVYMYVRMYVCMYVYVMSVLLNRFLNGIVVECCYMRCSTMKYHGTNMSLHTYLNLTYTILNYTKLYYTINRSDSGCRCAMGGCI